VTTSRERLLLLKNAVANLVRGSTAALVALLLPPFLTRSLSPAEFGAWALILQLSAYVGYLDFGVQTAVGRFVAHANERGDSDQRDKIVCTSLAVLTISGLVAWIGSLLLAAFLPHLFKQLPIALVGQVRIALVLVAGSLGVGLPASVFIGIFVGLQRNAIPASIIATSKVLSAVLVILIARHGGGLALMGASVAIINLFSYFFQYYFCLRIAPDMRFSLRYVNKSSAKELADYCFSLTIWSLGLLLVTGLDLTIVGYYRFNEVAYYSVAAVIVTFLGSFYNAIVSPMMPAAAVLHARGDARQLGQMVLAATRYGTLLLLVTGLPLIAGAHVILRVWVGRDYSMHSALIAQILITANIIRMCVTPYVVAMIGSGEQRLVVLTPLLEGVANLGCSLVAGYFLGALGVALGTFIGAIVGLLGMLLYNMRRTTAIQLSVSEYIQNSLLRPCYCALPVVAIMLVRSTGVRLYPFLQNTLQVVAICASLFLLWTVGLIPNERRNILAKMVYKPHWLNK
jgi:O-antigen/teichoic acid export membrane protein